jgi:hypothetical protein
MAEYFLAAWALHEASMSADTFCLWVAASADMAKDIAKIAAIVDISNLFMLILIFISPSNPKQF